MMKRLLPYALIFFITQTLLRLSLFARSLLDIEFTRVNLLEVVGRGLWFDTVICSFFLLPISLYYVFLPKDAHGKKADTCIDALLRFLFSFALLFDAVAEHLFWTEFSTRFNFIAVDYLVYTQEVVGNIVESYPLFWMLLLIGVSACIVTAISLRLFPLSVEETPRFNLRFAHVSLLVGLCSLLHVASTIEQAEIKGNAEASEVAANGIYNLFSAFWHNEINYDRFYANDSNSSVERNARLLLWEEEASFVHPDGKDLTRLVQTGKSEKHLNVILVVMESMSADYMEAFGNRDKITPSLDKLAEEGLFFTNTYATGTRTVRGLEAVTLSIPPTPGQSIIRRPHNDNLFSIGYVFKDRGYDTKFIYGGYGYFDNMNTFFSGNGFDVLDRTRMKKDEIHFANVWGVCDEDMFTRSLKEADLAAQKGIPFFHLIMTTSNHRPYTYPKGRIDIPSHSSRRGGVKYADYSIGKFIEEAKSKPWSKNTIFVFVADHTAGAGGKKELDPQKYHIPMIFYAPGRITPARYEPIASQIDLSPILLGMLDFNYYTKFYGEDLLHDTDEIPHAFISNYQKIALVKEDKMTVLAPKRQIEQYSWPAIEVTKKHDENGILDAIAYYQSASWWREHYKRIPTRVQ